MWSQYHDYHDLDERFFSWLPDTMPSPIPLAAGVLYPWGIVLSPAVVAVLMSLSTVIVAINAMFLRL